LDDIQRSTWRTSLPVHDVGPRPLSTPGNMPPIRMVDPEGMRLEGNGWRPRLSAVLLLSTVTSNISGQGIFRSPAPTTLPLGQNLQGLKEKLFEHSDPAPLPLRRSSGIWHLADKAVWRLKLQIHHPLNRLKLASRTLLADPAQLAEIGVRRS